MTNTEELSLLQEFQDMPHGADIELAGHLTNVDPDKMIDLSSNINPWGYCPELQEAGLKALSSVNRYPAPNPRRLCRLAAHQYQLPPDFFVWGNGGSDLIYRLALAIRLQSMQTTGFGYGSPNREFAVTVEPCFSEYREAFTAVGYGHKSLVLTAQTEWKLTRQQWQEAVKSGLLEGAVALILGNPNNPTGHLLDKELLGEIRDTCLKKRVYLVVDECFTDFLQRQEQLDHHLWGPLETGLVTIHSLTKFYSIPSLRAGYMEILFPELMKIVRSITPCWQLSGIAQAVAEKTFELDEKTKCQWRKWIGENREKMKAGLKALGATEICGSVNWVFFRYPDPQLPLKLLQGDNPILIRSCSNYIGLTDEYFRVAVKTEQETTAFLDKFKSIQ